MSFTPLRSHSAKHAYLTGGIDVTDICSDTRSTTNIVKAQGSDVRVQLKQEGERLANTSTSTENGDLLLTSSRGGEEAGGMGEATENRAGQHGDGR